MVRSDDFAAVVRSGRRAKTPTLVVHHASRVVSREDSNGGGPARVGFVVSKSVGGSVVRNRVARRLRAQVSSHLDRLPAGSGTVVRALPGAATAASDVLGADLSVAFDRLAGTRP